jgi:hypothetical protein
MDKVRDCQEAIVVEDFENVRDRERRSGERRNYYSWRSYIWRNSGLAEFDRRRENRRSGLERRERIENAILISATPD